MIVVLYDFQHRLWNDIKTAMKVAKVFKSFLSYSLLWNVNYGPKGTKAFFQKKQAATQELLMSPTVPPEFMTLLPYIAHELGQDEPQTLHGIVNLFRRVKEMKSLQVLGPCVKLMRWCSLWESYEFYEGENWLSKFVMNSTGTAAIPTSTDDVQLQPNLSPQEELKQLKIKFGSWSLAPQLVTPQSSYQKDLVAEMVRPLWTANSFMSQHVRSPREFQEFVMGMASGDWQVQLQDLVVHGFFDVPTMKKLYGGTEVGTAENLAIHHALLIKLLNMRAISLTDAFLMPPMRHTCLCREDKADTTSRQMQAEWETFLEAERVMAHGMEVRPIELCYFARTSFQRLFYLTNELDILQHKQGAKRVAATLAKTACQHPGNTVIIKNSCQKAKDTMREACRNQTSRVS